MDGISKFRWDNAEIRASKYRRSRMGRLSALTTSHKQQTQTGIVLATEVRYTLCSVEGGGVYTLFQ
jgi:hypothetical protein